MDVARVGSKYISASEFQKRMEKYRPVATVTNSPVSKESKLELLDQMLEEELILQAVEEKDLLRSDAGLRREAIRTWLRMEIPESERDYTEDEMKKFFDQNRDRFERVRARHILFRVDPSQEGMKLQNVQKRVEALVEKMKSGKEKGSFVDWVEEYSEDPISKKRGGDLFYVFRSQIEAPLADVLFSLEKGDIGGPVETSQGVHIVYIEDAQKGYATFQHAIPFQMKTLEMQKRRKAKIEELKKRKKIQVLMNNVDKVQLKREETSSSSLK